MGFSDKVIFNEPSLFITVISENKPVSKSDLIIALLAESEYSSPTLTGNYFSKVSLEVLLRPIKLISFI